VIDPRQVRARVFAQSADPAVAEVVLERTTLADRAAVAVRVPAFRCTPEHDAVHRLLVRLVDRRSPELRGEGLLTLRRGSDEGDPAPYFEGTVPLAESSTEDLRADVYDALSDVPPAVADADAALQEARRASVFLSEWRQLVAGVRLPFPAIAPAQLLRELARRLDPAAEAGGSHAPLFTGGPSIADLDRLAGRGDPALVARLARTDPTGRIGDSLFDAVGGAGGLLVAELAAVHSRAAA
jgi:hypothetical protein